jgi:hypothetical protein
VGDSHGQCCPTFLKIYTRPRPAKFCPELRVGGHTAGSGAKQITAPFAVTNPHFSIVLTAANVRDFDTVIWERQAKPGAPKSEYQSGPSYIVKISTRCDHAANAGCSVHILDFHSLVRAAVAKSCRAKIVLIPLLDVLQSVPVLRYLSLQPCSFVAVLPGNTLGTELATIFGIFTSLA